MGTIISSGVGSGLDIASLVSQLVEAEGRPLSARLDTQEAKAQAKLSALGSIRSALASFRDSLAALKSLDSFRGRSVTLSNEEFVKVSASSSATPGSYSIAVESVAVAHRLATAPQLSATDPVGTGTLTIQHGGSVFTVEVTAGDDTLAAIARAINEAPDNAGVTATVVTGDAGTRLVLASTQTGTENRIVVTQSGTLDAFVYDPDGSGVTNLDEINAATDALVLIDGFAVTSSTNKITSAIEGITIELLAAHEDGATTRATVGYNEAGARATLDKFVKAYNTLIDAVATVASYNAQSRQGGPLFGDAGVRNVGFQLRRELTAAVSGVSGPFDTLSDIGIVTQLDGKLSLDAAKLDAAFAADFDAVGELFAVADTGLSARLDKVLQPYLEFGGVLDSRTAGLRASIDDIADRREALSNRLASLQERYLRQFNALDGLLAQLQSTSAFLSQQLNNLPGYQLLKRDD